MSCEAPPRGGSCCRRHQVGSAFLRDWRQAPVPGSWGDLPLSWCDHPAGTRRAPCSANGAQGWASWRSGERPTGRGMAPGLVGKGKPSAENSALDDQNAMGARSNRRSNRAMGGVMMAIRWGFDSKPSDGISEDRLRHSPPPGATTGGPHWRQFSRPGTDPDKGESPTGIDLVPNTLPISRGA